MQTSCQRKGGDGSGLEGGLQVVDCRPFASREDHLDDVEAAGGRIPSESGQVEVGEVENLPPLCRGDRLGRGGEGVVAAALHLDEDEDVALPGQEIDLPATDAQIAREDPQAVALEVARGGPLAPASEPGG
jgi:hypothetical protein